MSVKTKRVPLLIGFVFLLAIVAAVLPQPETASAAQITSRSLTLQAGATDGGSKPGGVVNHLFSFTVATTGNVGSIKFEYCTTASGACTTPTGLVTTSATLGNETGATGFSIVNTTNGAPYLTRTASSIASSTAVTYRLDSITNPTATNTTFHVRISTYASTDTTGSATDTGTVTASTATQIVLTGTMPESLIFCTGATISTTGGIPDCSTATAGSVSFNQLFSPSDTATATSQMAASTNATSGYSISVNGPTLTSGSNTIAAMASATTGVRGTGQFGMNLKANTVSTSTPAVGTEVAPAANGTNYKGQSSAGYNTVDTFKFVSGDSVAASDNGGAGPTDSQIFTVAYIVNVPGSQIAGTYTTTLTYICTPTF
jgi:hypothetical protein